MVAEMDPICTLWEAFFSENIRKQKSVFGLRRRVRIAYEPIPWSAQGDPKIEKKRLNMSLKTHP